MGGKKSTEHLSPLKYLCITVVVYLYRELQRFAAGAGSDTTITHSFSDAFKFSMGTVGV